MQDQSTERAGWGRTKQPVRLPKVWTTRIAGYHQIGVRRLRVEMNAVIMVLRDQRDRSARRTR